MEPSFLLCYFLSFISIRGLIPVSPFFRTRSFILYFSSPSQLFQLNINRSSNFSLGTLADSSSVILTFMILSNIYALMISPDCTSKRQVARHSEYKQGFNPFILIDLSGFFVIIKITATRELSMHN